jgi:energy-coupling factor transporter ATP-binding protein EcfA2
MMDARRDFENPFSARRISPGAIPYLFPPGETVATLVDRLRQAGWWGQITGPHGSGKSTLLAALTAAIEHAGRPTVLVVLHDAERRLPLRLRSDPRLRPPVLLVIDGYEQLGRWNRLMLKRFCRRQGVGLLVTAHESVGLPDLFHAAVTPDLAERVVATLLEHREPPFTSQEVSQCLAGHGGDLRETLFDLYDVYEQRRPSSGQNMT